MTNLNNQLTNKELQQISAARRLRSQLKTNMRVVLCDSEPDPASVKDLRANLYRAAVSKTCDTDIAY